MRESRLKEIKDKQAEQQAEEDKLRHELETKHLKGVELEPSLVKKEEASIEIKSYHSSEEEKKRDKLGSFISGTKVKPDLSPKVEVLAKEKQKTSKAEINLVDKNFWKNYEKNLGIVKEEKAEESPLILRAESPVQTHRSEDEVQPSFDLRNVNP